MQKRRQRRQSEESSRVAPTFSRRCRSAYGLMRQTQRVSASLPAPVTVAETDCRTLGRPPAQDDLAEGSVDVSGIDFLPPLFRASQADDSSPSDSDSTHVSGAGDSPASPSEIASPPPAGNASRLHKARTGARAAWAHVGSSPPTQPAPADGDVTEEHAATAAPTHGAAEPQPQRGLSKVGGQRVVICVDLRCGPRNPLPPPPYPPQPSARPPSATRQKATTTLGATLPHRTRAPTPHCSLAGERSPLVPVGTTARWRSRGRSTGW